MQLRSTHISFSHIEGEMATACKFKSFREIVLGIFIGAVISHVYYSYSFQRTFALHYYGQYDSESFQNITAISESNYDEYDLAGEMRKHRRILCFLITQPANALKSTSILASWGKRCNVFYFVSTQQIENSTTVLYTKNDGVESGNILWGKTKLGFKYAYEKHFHDADWFLKADDDTYIIVENLRYLLLEKDPSQPVVYGCKHRLHYGQKDDHGFMDGGAGYVLSKESLRRLYEESLEDATKCRQDEAGQEDMEIAKCLSNVGVTLEDSRDFKNQSRFFHYSPEVYVIPGELNPNLSWYWQYAWHIPKQGLECCSDSAIGFHYVDINMLWTFEYLIYHVHPFGVLPRLSGSQIQGQVLTFLQKVKFKNVTKSQNINV